MLRTQRGHSTRTNPRTHAEWGIIGHAPEPPNCGKFTDIAGRHSIVARARFYFLNDSKPNDTPKRGR